MTCADTPLRHGYTLGDLEQMTRIAAGYDRSVAMDVQTKWDFAYSAIALALYEAEERPCRSVLIRAGWQAIYREVEEVRRGRGHTGALVSIADHPDAGIAPNWLRYWRYAPGEPFDERVAERLAVRQVLPMLSNASREAVIALAATGGYPEAAAALGISEGTLGQRLVRARRAWRAAWYGDETPHRLQTCDKRAQRELADVCGNGHVWLPETTGTTRKVKRGQLYETRYCKLCQRESAARSSKRRKVA